ncbi:regulator of cell cycle RGCC-like isoform X2 [Opisthocomus hoazin]|uniref:regulator of cell cycle RGCC-like isoform X2 n=1 Tax=Opisthocomus hoazin TaxID=30419 RepID=UPI003F530C56
MADELGELLREFEEVMEELEGPRRRAGHGVDELGSTGTSPGSSLSSSEEDLNTPASTHPSRAKLGDTQELEEFIADLDKVLEEM